MTMFLRYKEPDSQHGCQQDLFAAHLQSLRQLNRYRRIIRRNWELKCDCSPQITSTQRR